MIKFSRNSLKYQNVRSPPEHTANGNVHTDILLLGIIALLCHSKQFSVGLTCLMVLSDGLVYFLKIDNFFLSNPPKLSCGFIHVYKLLHGYRNYYTSTHFLICTIKKLHHNFFFFFFFLLPIIKLNFIPKCWNSLLCKVEKQNHTETQTMHDPNPITVNQYNEKTISVKTEEACLSKESKLLSQFRSRPPPPPFPLQRSRGVHMRLPPISGKLMDPFTGFST